MKKVFSFIFIILFFNLSYAAKEIVDYKSVFLPVVTSDKEAKIAIRSYLNNSKQYFVLVDPNSFKTALIPQDQIRLPRNEVEKQNLLKKLDNTPYVTALNKYTKPPYVQQNYGATIQCMR